MAVLYIKNGGASVTIKGKTYAKGEYVPIPYIKSDYNVSHEKLWGSDAGRTMSGDYKGTIVGIFPKITANISGTKLNYKDVEGLMQLLSQTSASCKFYDAQTASMKTQSFYFDSVSVTHKYIDISNPRKNKYDSISVVAVAISKE
jgi:hypothetical protein